MNAWASFVQQASVPAPDKFSHLTPAQQSFKRKQQAEANERLDAVVAYLKRHGETHTLNLARDLEWKSNVVYRTCSRGVELGRVKKTIKPMPIGGIASYWSVI